MTLKKIGNIIAKFSRTNQRRVRQNCAFSLKWFLKIFSIHVLKMANSRAKTLINNNCFNFNQGAHNRINKNDYHDSSLPLWKLSL